MNIFGDELLDLEDPTVQVDVSAKILEEVLALRTDVTRLDKQIELVCVEQRRQGQEIGKLLQLCENRARVCGVIATPMTADRPNGGDSGNR